ncbi:MAG: carnitine dehydratase [Syntrophomonadaceae bacterium]|jgi:L-carnitine CoA-transferase|nr:carnitine dehydratase [Syntrophomonadaceae bacterium]
MKISEVPSFGNLSGIKVVCTGNNVAAPFAGYLMAENGAAVICLESTKAPDSARMGGVPLGFMTERRNELALSLNLDSKEGQKVFLDLMKNVDILIEGYKGGTFSKWGLCDEALWEVNPKLVIVHVSGYGQYGEPEFVSRASYDLIGQAFGGYSACNGERGGEPSRAQPAAGDYFPALFACWSGLAAYIGTQTTGKGESVDIAQYEALWKVQWDYPSFYFTTGKEKPRSGAGESQYLGVDIYKCKTGNIAITLCATGPIMRLCKLLGVEDLSEYEGMFVLMRGEERAEKLDKMLADYLLTLDAEEADRIFNENQIPCSMIMSPKTMEHHPHALARNLFVEWEDPRYGTMKAVGAVPKMKNRPQQYWRDAPGYNADGRDILSELGYSEAEIDKLFADGVTKDLPNQGFRAAQLPCKSN